MAKLRVTERLFDVRPDRLDLRDLPYRPPLRSLPPSYPGDADVRALLPGYVKAGLIRDQGNEGACTGFGLACVMNYLLWVRHFRGGSKDSFDRVSERMLYELAKRYDEWPGTSYEGSSCRGALKGLHKHGVCRENLWPYPLKGRKSVFVSPSQGWEEDAARRPLGVYYRVRRDSVVDVQAAVVNIGAVYVSANVHDGWDDTALRPVPRKHADLPGIPPAKKPRKLFGHAFAIVGYDENGFIVQNSWGTEWGASGFAVLPYDDWVEHATDAWALALGVPVKVADTARQRGTLRLVKSSQWRVPSGQSLTRLARESVNPANPPDDPWPIDHLFEHEAYQPWSTHDAYLHTLLSGNDGELVVSDFTHSPKDNAGYAKKIVVDQPLQWFAAEGGSTLKLAIYAHGGLNGEEESIARIRVLAPYFAGNGIYPLFLTWKTGIGETLADILQHCVRKVSGFEDAKVAGILDMLGDVKDRAIEGFAHILAKGVWTQMRENAEAAKAPGRMLDLLGLKLAALQAALPPGRRLELHVVGHSAGSILLGHFLERITRPDMKGTLPEIETCTLYAAACSTQFAVTHYLPAADNGALSLARLWLHYLSDENEKKDALPTPKVPAYGKSLLYLVSRALDDSRKMPLLGMERSLIPAYSQSREMWAQEELTWNAQWAARWSPDARAIRVSTPDVTTTRENNAIQATHGSFDNSIAGVTATLERIRGKALVAPMEWLDY